MKFANNIINFEWRIRTRPLKLSTRSFATKETVTNSIVAIKICAFNLETAIIVF